MKTKILIMLILYCINANSQSKFYYGFDRKIFIEAISDTFILRTNESLYTTKKSETAYVVMQQYDNHTFQIKVNKPESIEEILSRTNVISLQPAYKVKDGFELDVTEEVICKAKLDQNEIQIIEVLKKFPVEIKNSNKHRIILTVKKGESTIDISNKLYETGLFIYAHPNFYAITQKSSYIPNDAYFGKQFYLKNTGQTINDGHSGTAGIDINATNAWDITKGSSGVFIAVIDGGVATNNPDLPSSRVFLLGGTDLTSDPAGNDPSPNGNDAHGTACAGIIAATQDNGQGISGIAPLCNIIPIKIGFGSSASTSTDVDAINLAVDLGADVVSCSWGFSSSDPALVPSIVTAISDAISNRVIVVFSVGNTADHTVGNDGVVEFPANCGVVGLMSIGACDRDGNQALYSPTDSKVDFVAPSHKAYTSQVSTESFEVWSTDIVSSAGYNPCNVNCNSSSSGPYSSGEYLPAGGINYLDYTGRMGGTSAACPQVAGVAALIRSFNPCLTPLEIKKAIQSTCRQIGGYTYTAGRCDEVGYGLIDAAAALNLAGTMYLQDITETSVNHYFGEIIAGKDVTNLQTPGDYYVPSGGSASLKAVKSITMEPGFIAGYGSIFSASIENVNTFCSYWTTSPILNKTNFYDANTTNIDTPLSLEARDIKIYPNPATNYINIDFFITNNQTVKIQLMDMYGREIYKLEDYRILGNYSEKISNLSQYANEVLLLSICRGNDCNTFKILKLGSY